MEVANWLAEGYSNNIKLTGIIYLHPINSPRVGGTAMKNLRMFKKLCGFNGLGSVVLATTMWSVADAKAPQRERELVQTDGFWKEMIEQGSRIFRVDSGSAGKNSAHKIVEHLVRRNRKVAMQVQTEMVEKKLSLDQTGAGQEMNQEIAKMRKMYETKMAKLSEEMKEALAKKDIEHQKELKGLKRELDAKIEQTEVDMEKLRVSKEGLRQQVDIQTSQEASELARKIEKAEKRLDDSERTYKTIQKEHENEMEIMKLKHQLALREQERKWIQSQWDRSCILM